MREFLIDSVGKITVKVGDEVQNADVRFFVGEINESQTLCFIDKEKPWTLLNPKTPMAACINGGDYGANLNTLAVLSATNGEG